jgi:ABC-type bacteriocin/lantibiotic exporter with double-glycine peptidase domain
LIPSIKGTFDGFSTIHHNADAVRIVLEYCRQPDVTAPVLEIVRPKRELKLESVSYQYRQADDLQLDSIDVSIQTGTSVCFFGSSGAGKSTVLNLLVGLISPKSGRILVDDVALAPAYLNSWRKKLGYCPQKIFLFNDSLASNIAFGVPTDRIDLGRVREVGRLAMLDPWVLQSLPQGYATVIGEDGNTLSGGQRQRIGIARALYHNPDIIVLDEALSGLDVANRTAILDSLFSLRGKTLIFSSHDTDTASRCDNIVVLKDGRQVAQGRYAELSGRSELFKNLIATLEHSSDSVK